MIEKLLNMYPSSKLQESPPEGDGSYKWYYDSNDNVYMGFSRDELSKEIEKVLDQLFEKWEQTNLQFKHNQSMLQQAWFKLLKAGQEPGILEKVSEIRFTQVQLFQSDVSSVDIEEACYGFFHEAIQTVWVSDTTLILIETDKSAFFQMEDLIAFSKILEGDFYVKVKMYLGKYHTVSDWEEIRSIFIREQKIFHEVRDVSPKESLFTFEKIAPLIMKKELPSPFISMLMEEYSTVLEDKELLHTLQVYIENNMNTSLTAKKMFMHRNSLMYRIDKFTEKTGLDIKQFEAAWVIYFLSLLEK